MYEREGSGKRYGRQKTRAVRITGPSPALAYCTRTRKGGSWCMAGGYPLGLQPSELQATIAPSLRFDTASPSQPRAKKTSYVGFVSQRTTRRTRPAPKWWKCVRCGGSGLPLGQMLPTSLRVCNTAVKIGEFHFDSNFSEQHER